MVDAKAKELRVIVKISDGHPELRDALLKVPPRARAERLRHLALSGIAASIGHVTSTNAFAPTPTPKTNPSVDDTKERRRERLLKRAKL